MSLINGGAFAIARRLPKRQMKNSAFPLLLPVRFVFITCDFLLSLVFRFLCVASVLSVILIYGCLAMHVPFSSILFNLQASFEIRVNELLYLQPNAQTQMINDGTSLCESLLTWLQQIRLRFLVKTLLFCFAKSAVQVILLFQWQPMRTYQFTVNHGS